MEIPLSLFPGTNPLKCGRYIDSLDIVRVFEKYWKTEWEDKLFECLELAKSDGLLTINEDTNEIRFLPVLAHANGGHGTESDPTTS